MEEEGSNSMYWGDGGLQRRTSVADHERVTLVNFFHPKRLHKKNIVYITFRTSVLSAQLLRTYNWLSLNTLVGLPSLSLIILTVLCLSGC